jgi:DNA polymerase III delta prime subunit
MEVNAMTSSELTKELRMILEEELSLTLELTEIAQEKLLRLSDSDVKGLENVLQREEDAAARLQDKETQRLEAAAQLAGILGLKPGEFRLKDLIDSIDNGTDKILLNETRQRLKFAVNSLARTNKKALALAEQKIKYTDYIINLMYAPQKKSNLYDVQGKLNENRADTGRVDYTV